MISTINIRYSFSEFIVKPFETNIIQRKIGINPEKYLMSSLLKTQQNQQPIPQDLNLNIKDKYEPRYFQRIQDYSISRQQYNQYAHNHPHGKVHLFNYQDINFTIAGSSWEHIPNKNLYKLLIYTRPNAILLQMRPDQLLQKFDSTFHSSKEYIKQITRNGEEIMPSGYANKIKNELELDDVEFPEFLPYTIKERINYDKIATISYYAQMNNIPILLIDLPEKIFRYSLANQLTLVQLQEYFKESTRLTPQHPDILPNTPMNIAYLIFPDVFLKKSDEFMTTIIEYLAAKKQYKKIFALVGNMQSDSIVNLLENKQSSHLKIELEIPKIKGSLFKQLTCEDLLERHAILDVMYNGKDLFYELDTIKIRYSLLYSTSLHL